MPHLSDEQWNRLGFPDYRPRFFIECWWGYLNRDTPHFYQARLMNPFNAMRETANRIRDCLSDPQNANSLHASATETCAILHANKDYGTYDPVRRDHILSQITPLKSARIDASTSDVGLQQKAQLLHNALQYESDYVEDLKRRLLESILDGPAPTDTGTRRLLDRIYELTGSILSHLLAVGYSSTYLYKRPRALTNLERYQGRTLAQQLSATLDRLTLDTAPYRIVFALDSSAHILSGDTSVLGIDVCTSFRKLSISGNAAQFDLPNPNTYATTRVTAPDYISAAWIAHRKLQSLLDLATFEYKDDRVHLSPTCIVVHGHEGSGARHPVKIDQLIRLLHRQKRKDPYPIDLSAAVNQIVCGDQIDAESKESLLRVLRYYRLGITSTSFESKFLAMWIAVEALVQGHEDAAIERIQAFVPIVYAVDSLTRRLGYLNTLLSRYGGYVPDEIKSDVGWDSFSDEMLPNHKLLYYVLIDDERTRKVYDTLTGCDYARYRLCQAYEDFHTPERVERRVKSTREDVERQLLRIYHLRNRIVHRADAGPVDIRIYSHLCDYIGCALSEVLVACLAHPEARGLSHVLQGYRLGLEQKMITWRQEKQLTFEDVIFVEPIL